MTIEQLAKVLHEAGREAVEKNKIVHEENPIAFIEWDALSENAREGRYIQARYLLGKYVIYPKRARDKKENIEKSNVESIDGQSDI